MKKSLTLVFATTLLATGALTAFALRKGENIQFAGNGYQQSVFSLDMSTRGSSDPDVKYSADVYGVKTERTTKISTTFKRGALSNEKVVVDSHDYVTWQNDEDSPIRGISRLSFNIENFLMGNFSFFMYFSYNHLNLADILAGKYSDLVGYYPMGGSSSENTVSFDVSQLQARYFLAVIINNSASNQYLIGGSVQTPCDPNGEPEVVAEVGDYVIPNEHKELLPADFPLLPNGSYYYMASGPMAVFYTVQNYMFLTTYSQELDNAGYNFVGLMMGAYVFQKPATTEGKYKTIVIVPPQGGQSTGDISFIQVAYYGEQDYMGSDGSWPSDKISTVITEEDIQNAFVAPTFSTVSPAYTFMDAGNGRSVIMVDGISTASEIEEARAVLKGYVDGLIDSEKFLRISNDSSEGFDSDGHLKNDATRANYSAILVSYNLKYSISMYIYAERDTTSDDWGLESFVFMIEPHDLLNLAQVNSSVVLAFGENVFPELDVSFAYCSQNYYSTSSSSSTLQFYMTGVTISSFDNYFAALEAKGFNVYPGEGGTSKNAHLNNQGVDYSFHVTIRGQIMNVDYFVSY